MNTTTFFEASSFRTRTTATAGIPWEKIVSLDAERLVSRVKNALVSRDSNLFIDVSTHTQVSPQTKSHAKAQALVGAYTALLAGAANLIYFIASGKYVFHPYFALMLVIGGSFLGVSAMMTKRNNH